MKILVVEDDPKISAFISKGLKESGYITETAMDGIEALEHQLPEKLRQETGL